MLVYELSFNPIAEHNIKVTKSILFQPFDSPSGGGLTLLPIFHSTVTLFARFLGLSTSQSRFSAA